MTLTRINRKFKKLIYSWKYPSILLFGIGVSNIGDWIYLIALNLIILDMTGSPLAVAALYILKPVATLVTNFWAGSVIDRLNKRNLMLGLDIYRAVFIGVLPLFSSLWLIYVIVFLINMASSMFEPTSMTYITKLIPLEQRKRFNSFRSLIDSGGFLIGPAIAGVLFMAGTPEAAIYINAFSLLLSGLVTLFMPNLEKHNEIENRDNLSIETIKRDWGVVWKFSRHNLSIMIICLLFSGLIVMMTAIDSLEAAFAKEVLNLSDSDYGFLVSIAGAGIVVGAFVNTSIANKIKTPILIGLGSIFVSVGYIVYAFSTDFIMAAAGFFILSFSLAFANTGFYTFYQNSISVAVMGRVGSVIGLMEATLIIFSTVIIGVCAERLSTQFAVICGTLVMLFVTGVLCIYVIRKGAR